MVKILERREPSSTIKIKVVNEAGLTGTTIVPQPHETTELQEVAILLADALILLARLDTGHGKFQVAVTAMEQLQRMCKRHG